MQHPLHSSPGESRSLQLSLRPPNCLCFTKAKTSQLTFFENACQIQSKELSQLLLCENHPELLERLLLTSPHGCSSDGLRRRTETGQEVPPHPGSTSHACKPSAASLQVLCRHKSHPRHIGQGALRVVSMMELQLRLVPIMWKGMDGAGMV